MSGENDRMNNVKAIQCGARSKRTGERCQSMTLYPNGKCYHHGGPSKGPAKGTTNAKRHGLYASVLDGKAKEVYSDALNTPEREVAKDSAALLAARLAAAHELPEAWRGGMAKVIAAIDALVRDQEIGFDFGLTCKRKLAAPGLGDVARAVSSQRQALDFAAKPLIEDEDHDDDTPTGSGVLVLPAKDQDDAPSEVPLF